MRAHAAAAGRQFDAWLARLQAAEDRGDFAAPTPETAAAVGRMVVRNALASDAQSLRDGDWDVVAQHYLGLAAAYHAAGGAGGAAGGGSPPSTNSGPPWPSRAAAAARDSPADYQPAAALAPLHRLHSLTAPTETRR